MNDNKQLTCNEICHKAGYCKLLKENFMHDEDLRQMFANNCLQKEIQSFHESMPLTEEQERIVKILGQHGGDLWRKNEFRRIYFDRAVIMKFGRLRLERYGTGNIFKATLRGERITNSEAYRYCGELNQGKFYYDLVKGGFHIERVKLNYAESMVEGFLEKMQSLIM